MLLRWLERKLTFKPDRVKHADISRFNFDAVELKGEGQTTTVFSKIHGNGPVILFSHGNTGNISFYTWFYDLFESLGLSYVTYDYPGYGESRGFASEASLLWSGRSVWSYLTETRGIHPKSIYHFGLSLGGGVATDLAVTYPSAGIILECSFTDSHGMAKKIFPRIPLYRFVPNRFRNIEKIKDISVPLLLVHGTLDATVPVHMADTLYAAHCGPKDLYIVEGAGHADIGIIGKEEYRKRLASFLGIHG